MTVEDQTYVYDKAIINRINRLQGQINGAKKMIEEGENCRDVVTQLSAAKSAAIPLGWEARDEVRALGERLTVLRIPDQAFPVAAMVGGVVPSVDAVHLGVAVADADIDTFLTYERQSAQVARMYGLLVLTPGLPDHWWA